jgi:hypothetical protein
VLALEAGMVPRDLAGGAGEGEEAAEVAGVGLLEEPDRLVVALLEDPHRPDRELRPAIRGVRGEERLGDGAGALDVLLREEAEHLHRLGADGVAIPRRAGEPKLLPGGPALEEIGPPGASRRRIALPRRGVALGRGGEGEGGEEGADHRTSSS